MNLRCMDDLAGIRTHKSSKMKDIKVRLKLVSLSEGFHDSCLLNQYEEHNYDIKFEVRDICITISSLDMEESEEVYVS